MPAIFFHYYNKIVYILSYLIFVISTIFIWIKPIVLNSFKIISIILKFIILICIYFTPIIYRYLKNNFLVFTKNVKTRKLFFINNLYNSFSSKILLSGTAFFSIYILIFILVLIIILPFFVLKQQTIVLDNLEFLDSSLVEKAFLNNEIKVFNNLSLTKTHFVLCLLLSCFLFILSNLVHSFLAFLSLCYDYLLKKLNSENFFILFIISSTTLQIFFKLLSLILFI